jgi:hypothetical protein
MSKGVGLPCLIAACPWTSSAVRIRCQRLAASPSAVRAGAFSCTTTRSGSIAIAIHEPGHGRRTVTGAEPDAKRAAVVDEVRFATTWTFTRNSRIKP